MAAIGVPQRDFLCPLAAGQAARPACPHGAWCRQPQQRGPGPGSALSTAEPSSCGGKVPHRVWAGVSVSVPPRPRQVRQPRGSFGVTHVPTDGLFASSGHFPGAALPAQGSLAHAQPGVRKGL